MSKLVINSQVRMIYPNSDLRPHETNFNQVTSDKREEREKFVSAINQRRVQAKLTSDLHQLDMAWVFLGNVSAANAYWNKLPLSVSESEALGGL